MQIRSGFAALLVLGVLCVPAIAEPQSSDPAPALLATGHLASVVDLPLYFRLYGARLPAAQHASYSGASAMLYDLSGEAAIELDGVARPLAEGDGAFIATGQEATITAPGREPATLLLFILTPRPNQKPPLDRPALVQELYRTGDPLPGLEPGPYEFTLARVSFPAGMPANPPHYRTGTALSYVVAGAGSLIADGKIEAMPAGSAQVSPSGWLHRWANPGAAPLVIVQAGIWREGQPAVVQTPAK